MSDQGKGSTFEELYLQQRKKSSMLLIAVIVLAVTTAGSVAWGMSKTTTSNPSNRPSDFQGQGFDGQNSPRGGMRGGMNMNIKQFFKDDGSVDTSAVDSFMSRMPSGGQAGNSGFNFLDRFKEMIDQSVEKGDITEDQGNALMDAFEAENNANEA
ncbi:MAG TPA: hypothetical protein PKD19_01190 [Candidatus Saccharibacteria bacterium]|nr:hypothetical protein [Candidatus Saccharibacteria bacterium]HMR38016.1 hypothetical protein [Candidatus Saccharibacteria bacterium]